LGAPRWLLKWNPELGESQAAKREGIEREREREREREEEEEKDVLITEFLISERTNEWSDVVVVVVVLCSRSKRKWRLARAKDENEIRSRRLQQSLGGGSSSSR
jgi:hypothetical protein